MSIFAEEMFDVRNYTPLYKLLDKLLWLEGVRVTIKVRVGVGVSHFTVNMLGDEAETCPLPPTTQARSLNVVPDEACAGVGVVATDYSWR